MPPKHQKTTFLLAPQGTPVKRAPSSASSARRKLSENEKFAAFPRGLLDRIDGQFQLRMSKISAGWEPYPPPSWKPRFALNTGATHLYPPGETRKRAHVASNGEYCCVSAANTGLLLLLLEMEPQLAFGENQFHELDTAMDMEELDPNPSPLALHAIRRGEIGYHFDKHGSLAICFLREGAGGIDHVVRDDVFRVVPRDLRRICYFVNATSGAATPPKKTAVPLRFFISKKRAPDTQDEESDDDDNVVARLAERAKRAKREREEEAEKKMEADFGSLRGFY